MDKFFPDARMQIYLSHLMNQSRLFTFAAIRIIILTVRCFKCSASTVSITGDGSWSAEIDREKGVVYSYTGHGVTIPFRTDTLAGPQWRGIEMKADDADAATKPYTYDGASQTVTVTYGTDGGRTIAKRRKP